MLNSAVNGILKILLFTENSPEYDVGVQRMNEEISLREIIEIILKQKWIIIIFTIACMLVSAIFSFFVLAPTYETYSIVRMQSAASGDGGQVTDIKEFQETLKSSSTLNSLIDKNGLDRNEYTINTIRNMFKLDLIPNSNIMKIIVQGDNPKKISQMANMLAYELGIRVEITDRTKVVVNAQKHLDDLKDQIAITEAKLSETQSQLKITPEKQVTAQALSENDLLRAIEQERSNSSTKDAAKLQMQSESINPVYSDLQAKVAQSTIDLNSLRAEAKNYQDKIDSNMNRINEIESKAVNDKLDINKSIRILDGTNAIFINPSLEPDSPVGPKKLLNTAVAGVVGLMLSLLFAFLRNYMKDTRNEAVRSGVDV